MPAESRLRTLLGHRQSCAACLSLTELPVAQAGPPLLLLDTWQMWTANAFCNPTFPAWPQVAAVGAPAAAPIAPARPALEPIVQPAQVSASQHASVSISVQKYTMVRQCGTLRFCCHKNGCCADEAPDCLQMRAGDTVGTAAPSGLAAAMGTRPYQVAARRPAFVARMDIFMRCPLTKVGLPLSVI